MTLRLVDPPVPAAEQDRPRQIIGQDLLERLAEQPHVWLVVLADDENTAAAYARIHGQAFRLRTRRKVTGGRVESRIRTTPTAFTVEARYVPDTVTPAPLPDVVRPASGRGALWLYGRVGDKAAC